MFIIFQNKATVSNACSLFSAKLADHIYRVHNIIKEKKGKGNDRQKPIQVSQEQKEENQEGQVQREEIQVDCINQKKIEGHGQVQS